ncbi:3TM-type holin [Halomonas sp. I1]|uniref:3TM-type holin n=1 Tax=Halomonas sp. I1 TaxID=393536 RepID=UPI0028DE421C|nr:3TM-type holin [Halomonas sp. I1]MDT8895468.1 3TM-type holin [Halomonas sp. I1]
MDVDWSGVAKTVGKVAPAAGGALAGPLGAAVGGVIADKLGVERTPEAVEKAINDDPQAAMKLREIEADIEKALIGARADVVQAEANAEGWLQRNWRPMVMLWFAALVGAHWLGFTPENLDTGTVSQLLDIVQYGLTGYVVGRSAEKITRHVSGSGFMAAVKAKVK